MKIAIITSVFGNSQPIHTPNKIFKDVDYFAFVDKPHACEGWTQIISPSFSLDEKYKGRRDAKIYKIMPHLFLPDYDYWIWADPTHEAIVDPHEICEKLGDKDIGLFKHIHRDCAYQEALEVARLEIDYPKVISDQTLYYQLQAFPEHHGLYELPVFVRKNTPAIQELNMKWWELICRYSSRDQISLPFILWKMGITPHVYEGWANGGLLKNNCLPQVRWKFN